MSVWAFELVAVPAVMGAAYALAGVLSEWIGAAWRAADARRARSSTEGRR